MAVPKFDLKELEVVGQAPGIFGGAIFNYPVTAKEAYKAALNRKPIWQITGVERKSFVPKVNPDAIARAAVADGSGTPQTGGKDMFGIDWEFVPSVGGSMVRPGKPFLEDIDELFDKVVWPDIESWDWEGNAKISKDYLQSDNLIVSVFHNGWFERLISFLDFENAILAMIDEDQKDIVKEFFDKLTDLYIRIFDKYLTYFPEIDMFIIHDDWGSQKETFFSPAVAEEMIVPYMRRVTDFLHSKGRFCELHSCGQNMKQIPNIIAAGWDSWNAQAMNDTQKIYELYGDKLVVAVIPDAFDPKSTTEEEQRAAARAYAEKFCNPDKPSFFNFYGGAMLTPAFREELYKQSRINYGK